MPDPSALPATVDVDTAHPLGRVNPDIYGHFLESAFFGNIEGGVMDEGSELSITEPGPLQGLRSDVLELCRELGPTVVRWPGGNFASAYHWEDGIGPRDDRPSRLELAWGDLETNRFGTDEFLAWCEAVGAEAYLAHSARDTDEAVRWVEYTNAAAGRTTLTRQRAANGRPDPWRVRYWGIGNEVYGPWQMGYRDAEAYGRAAREHARFMKLVDPEIVTVGVGLTDDRQGWTEQVLRHAGRYLDLLSFHLYAADTSLYTGDDYDAVVGQSVYVEQALQDYSRLVEQAAADAGLDAPPPLALDEWNVRHLEPASWPEPQAGADGGIADREIPEAGAEPYTGGFRVNRWDPRNLADAIYYAGVFNAVHRSVGLAAPVAMTNPVNLVNANGLVVARPGGAVRSAIHGVWTLFRHHTGATVLPTEVHGTARTGSIRLGDHRRGGQLLSTPGTVADLDVTSTRAEDGSVRLAVINRHRDRPVHARVLLDGSAERVPVRARVRCLGGDVEDPYAVNLLSAPDTVAVRDLGDVDRTEEGWTFPPHSFSVLTLDRS